MPATRRSPKCWLHRLLSSSVLLPSMTSMSCWLLPPACYSFPCFLYSCSFSWPLFSDALPYCQQGSADYNLCSLIPSDSHETFFQPFDDLNINGVYLIRFWFSIRIYPHHITKLDPYFLHLAGAHFVPLVCAHCHSPGVDQKNTYIIYHRNNTDIEWYRYQQIMEIHGKSWKYVDSVWSVYDVHHIMTIMQR